MRFNDVITLIDVAPDGINEHGFSIETEEQRNKVFGNKKSVRGSEFYQAWQIGIEVKFIFEMRLIDYNNEEYAEFEGKRYKILRTYENKNGEFVELTLSDLSERGVDDGEF